MYWGRRETVKGEKGRNERRIEKQIEEGMDTKLYERKDENEGENENIGGERKESA